MHSLKILHCPVNGCGVCADCKRIINRIHEDIIWLVPDTSSGRISIESIRNVIDAMSVSAIGRDRKSCVILNAERLTAEAGNALLKTLEEPMGNKIFFIITEYPDMLLPTVYSRAQHLYIRSRCMVREDIYTRFIEVIKRYIDSGKVDNVFLWYIFMEELNTIRQRIEEEFLQNAADITDDKKITDLVEAEYRLRRIEMIKALMMWLRDILFKKYLKLENYLFFEKDAYLLDRFPASNFRALLNLFSLLYESVHMLELNIPEKHIFLNIFQNG